MKKMLQMGFNPAKCKTSLKMAVSRIKILRNKKDIQLKQLKREIAQLLENGQDQTARIRVEHVVREEKTIAAYDLIDLYCELIVARLPIIESQKNCPIDLKEAIASVIFASPRCSDIPELMDARKHFTAKYGRDFVNAAIELRPDCGVTRTLIEKLSAVSPDGPTKVKILTGIAEEHNIKWEPSWFKDNEPEPPAFVQNDSNINQVSKMRVEPPRFQAAPSFEPKHEIPSNVHHIDGSQTKHPSSAYMAARPSGTEHEMGQFTRSTGGVEDATLKDRQKWSMEFKDASAAANAAAESAELASMAARAAAEFANHGNVKDHSTADSNNLQSEGNKRHFRNTEQDAPVDRFHKDNSSRGNSSTGHMQRDSSQVKTSGMIDENGLEKEFHQSVEHDAYQQYAGKESTSEVERKMDQSQSLEHDVGGETGYESSPEDPELSRTSGAQAASPHGHDHDIFSYSDHPHDDDFAENPFSRAVESRNEPSSDWSHSGVLGGNYGITSSSIGAKYDSDPDEDPFGSIGQGSFYNELIETKEPFHSTVSKDRQDAYNAFSEHNYGFEPHELHSIHAVESTVASPNDAPPHFDDYVADEDEYVHSAGRKSPVYSSPDEDSLRKELRVSASKLYQSEVTQSFKNSPLYSQLVKPVSLGDDSDGANSENEEEVKEHRITDISSPRKGLYSSPFVPEQSAVEENPEESIEKEFRDSARKKTDSDDLSTTHTSGRVRSNSNTKSFDRQSFSRLVEEAERLSSPRASSLRTTPDVIDDSQHGHQSNAESRTELNVESLTGGLRNKGYKLPPYTRATPTYPSSPSPPISDDAQEVQKISCSLSDEIKELSSQKESIVEKKTSKLQGIHIDSEDISSGWEVVSPTVSTKVRPVATSSRRTKASSTSAAAAAASVKRNRKPVIQMQSLEPQRRREEGKTSAPSVSEKQTNSPKEGTSGPTVTEIPTTSNSSEKTLLRDGSDKKTSHVHPKLPDYDDFASHFLSLRKNRQQ